MRILWTIICLTLWTQMAVGQIKVSGKVIGESDQLPIIGASVQEQGTQNGTLTDINGEYTLEINSGSIIEFRFLGMENKEVQYSGQSQINVSLIESALTLDNVVVTAFGIEKSKKAAGFSVSEIDGDALAQAREVNVGAQLVGQVAGLEITKPSNGPSGATRIVIRGLSQFQGENRPLLVIDGVPADNTNANTGGLYGGRDSGDGLSSINPADIENITVLKGPAASALYGSRAGNGVVLITTKKGVGRKGIGVEFSSNYVAEQVSIFPKYQQEYGQGANGLKPTTQQEAFDNWRSWGAKLDGSLTPIFNGQELPYSPVAQLEMPNFYNVGSTWTNSLSLVGGTDKMNARLSFSKLDNASIIPNTFYDRYTINLFTRAELSDRISIEGKVNYSQEDATNRTNLTDNPSNPAKYFTIGPANLPQDVFEQTRDENGNPIYWSNNPFTLSPYWGVQENFNEDTKRRLLGFVSAKYKLHKQVSLTGRIATDETNQDFLSAEIDGTQFILPGAIFINEVNVIERNYDLILSAYHQFTKSIKVDFNGGLVRTDRKLKNTGLQGSDFIIPQFISINNLAVQRPGSLNISNSRINAMFGSLSVALLDYLYLEGSVRSDFFSVLTNPLIEVDQENSITYGSGAASFILSDAMTMPSWVNFAKFRLGYGSSGYGQIDPYSQVPVYTVSSIPKELPDGNVTTGEIQGNTFNNPSLKPSRTIAFEVGADFRFFSSRLGLDITYYNQKTDKHIFPSPLAASTGYGSYLINAGVVNNQGLETAISYKIIDRGNFEWNVNANFARNVNKVISLNDGVDQLNLGVDRTFSANIVAQTGGRIGDIWGNVYERNEDGAIVFGENGLANIAEEREILGNFNPDWYGGLTSSFKYKDFGLSFLIDTKQGGEILSTTSSFGYLFGTGIKTLPGRDNPDFMIVGEGVTADGSPNTTPARIDDYYERISSISEENVYDASYVKFRQLSLSYTMNPNMLKRTKIFHGMTISIVGRNLFFFQNGLSELGLDPESIYTATATDVGIEYSALPSTRTYGVNLQFKL